MRKILFLTLLLACLFAAAPRASHAQTRKVVRQVSLKPEAVTRRFYAWYLGRLNKDDWHPLRRRREALRYVTTGLHRRAPALTLKWDVDIFICAQDWMQSWEKQFKVAPASVSGTKASAVVTLPVNGNDDIRIKVMLRRVRGVWKIDATDCMLPFEEARQRSPFDASGASAARLPAR